VVANDAIGNFVAATPLLQMLRAAHPSAHLAFFGGSRTREFQEASDLFDEHRLLHGPEPRDALEEALRMEPFHLVCNMESTALSKTIAAVLAGDDGWVSGPCVNRGGRGDLPPQDDDRGRLLADREWTSPHLQERYPFLESSFIGEIFCRLAYLEGPVPRYRLPVQDPERTVPDVLIATTASLPEKLWPVEKWQHAVGALADSGVTVGLLGAPPSQQKAHWAGAGPEDHLAETPGVEDLRGRLSLPQVAGALRSARAVLTLDNGILHMAAAVDAPTVGLFRHGIHRLWAPPHPGLRILTPGEGRAVSELEPDQVLETLMPLVG
jgi:heptosyltransferase III